MSISRIGEQQGIFSFNKRQVRQLTPQVELPVRGGPIQEITGELVGPKAVRIGGPLQEIIPGPRPVPIALGAPEIEDIVPVGHRAEPTVTPVTAPEESAESKTTVRRGALDLEI